MTRETDELVGRSNKWGTFKVSKHFFTVPALFEKHSTKCYFCVRNATYESKNINTC